VDVIVAQGTEGGGHGGTRATMTLVPEIADLIAKRAPQTLLCAAGGIADGRGLAAALMLGADAAVIGTRFWATREALVPPTLHEAAMAANGDATIRQSVLDVVRQRAWPARYTGRVLRSAFVADWLGREAELRADPAAAIKRFKEGAQAADPNVAATIVGECVGLIDSIMPAGALVEKIAADAEALLGRGAVVS
jgi:nitronate monooxygenase